MSMDETKTSNKNKNGAEHERAIRAIWIPCVERQDWGHPKLSEDIPARPLQK
jgi:hypothetical protein